MPSETLKTKMQQKYCKYLVRMSIPLIFITSNINMIFEMTFKLIKTKDYHKNVFIVYKF